MTTLVLAGCVVQKQQMPANYYDQFAARDFLANKCASLGAMDYQLAAAAKNYNARDLNSWAYDPMLLQSSFSRMTTVLGNTNPTKDQCSSFAIMIAQRLQNDQSAYQQKQLAAQQQQAFSESMQAIRNSAPKTTYCNKIGGQTVCNTY